MEDFMAASRLKRNDAVRASSSSVVPYRITEGKKYILQSNPYPTERFGKVANIMLEIIDDNGAARFVSYEKFEP